MRNKTSIAACMGLAALLAGPAEAETRVEVGILNCSASSSTGYIVTSTKYLRCQFKRPGRDEFYRGTVSKFGIDIGSTKELIASGRSVEEVRERIGADSLQYLSIPGLMRAIGRGTAQEFCRACFDGSYPVPVPQQLEMDKFQFEPTTV